MAKQISNNFVLTAMINGKTLITGINVIEGVLFQSLDVAGNLAPDWTNAGPKFKAVVKDTNGTAHPSLAAYEKLYWNGVEVTFDNAGLSNAIGSAFAAGTFKRTTGSDGTYTYQIVKNFFSASTNADSDQFRIEGKIELVGGNYQDFTTPDQPVTLVRYSTGGTPYIVLINNVHNITTQGGTGYMDAFLYDVTTMTIVKVSGTDTPVAPTSWANVDGTGTEIPCTASGYVASGNRLTIPASKVNGYDNFCAIFEVGGQQFRGYGCIQDETDNIYVAYDIDGVTNGEVSENGTARVKIFVADKDGNVLNSWGTVTLVPHVVLRSDAGQEVIPTTYSGTADALANPATVVNNITYKGEAWKGTLAVPYDKLVSQCGGRLQGWISLDPAE